MTDQEAIQQFKEMLAMQDYKEQIPEYYEAMELAVKALKMRIPVSGRAEAAKQIGLLK